MGPWLRAMSTTRIGRHSSTAILGTGNVKGARSHHVSVSPNHVCTRLYTRRMDVVTTLHADNFFWCPEAGIASVPFM